MLHALSKCISSCKKFSWHEIVGLSSDERFSLIWMLLTFLFMSVNSKMHYDYCHVKKCHAILPLPVYRHTEVSLILENASSSIFLVRLLLALHKETLVLMSSAFKILRESWCRGNARSLC